MATISSDIVTRYITIILDDADFGDEALLEAGAVLEGEVSKYIAYLSSPEAKAAAKAAQKLEDEKAEAVKAKVRKQKAEDDAKAAEAKEKADHAKKIETRAAKRIASRRRHAAKVGRPAPEPKSVVEAAVAEPKPLTKGQKKAKAKASKPVQAPRPIQTADRKTELKVVREAIQAAKAAKAAEKAAQQAAARARRQQAADDLYVATMAQWAAMGCPEAQAEIETPKAKKTAKVTKAQKAEKAPKKVLTIEEKEAKRAEAAKAREEAQVKADAKKAERLAKKATLSQEAQAFIIAARAALAAQVRVTDEPTTLSAEIIKKAFMANADPSDYRGPAEVEVRGYDPKEAIDAFIAEEAAKKVRDAEIAKGRLEKAMSWQPNAIEELLLVTEAKALAAKGFEKGIDTIPSDPIGHAQKRAYTSLKAQGISAWSAPVGQVKEWLRLAAQGRLNILKADAQAKAKADEKKALAAIKADPEAAAAAARAVADKAEADKKAIEDAVKAEAAKESLPFMGSRVMVPTMAQSFLAQKALKSKRHGTAGNIVPTGRVIEHLGTAEMEAQRLQAQKEAEAFLAEAEVEMAIAAKVVAEKAAADKAAADKEQAELEAMAIQMVLETEFEEACEAYLEVAIEQEGREALSSLVQADKAFVSAQHLLEDAEDDVRKFEADLAKAKSAMKELLVKGDRAKALEAAAKAAQFTKTIELRKGQVEERIVCNEELLVKLEAARAVAGCDDAEEAIMALNVEIKAAKTVVALADRLGGQEAVVEVKMAKEALAFLASRKGAGANAVLKTATATTAKVAC